jgi:hypothetical protein
MNRWQAHRRALLMWAVASAVLALVLGLVSRSHSSLLDFGVAFDVLLGLGVGLLAFAAVAAPTTLLVALARNATATYVVAVHAVALFVVMLVVWWTQG